MNVDSTITIHLSSEYHRAEGAVLAGAVLVLLHSMSAKNAWAKIRQGCPKPATNPSKAWDRFPLPFSKSDTTTASSVSVFDCLAALETARDLGWLHYDTFNIATWQYLRRKFN